MYEVIDFNVRLVAWYKAFTITLMNVSALINRCVVILSLPPPFLNLCCHLCRQVEPFLPYEYTCEGMLERVHAYIQNQVGLDMFLFFLF